MVPFREFIELNGSDHKNGTYVEWKLSLESAVNLKNACEKLGINNILDPSSFHVTICYSRKPVPKLADVWRKNSRILATGKKWSLFDTQSGGKCLVLEIDSQNTCETYHEICKDYGASHDFPEYKPYVTICYDYDKDEVPNKIPDTKLIFDECNVKPLDPEFIPGKE